MGEAVATLKWKWILWQVVVPILGPIAISIVAVVLWWTGRTDFRIHWGLIVDITPWALTFYAVTLIGAALNDLIPDFSRRPGNWFFTDIGGACCIPLCCIHCHLAARKGFLCRTENMGGDDHPVSNICGVVLQ